MTSCFLFLLFCYLFFFFFFFQAEDGIRDIGVTGVQTCALPIWIRLNHHAGWLAPLKNLPHYKLFALDSQLFAPLPWSALRHLARDGFSCAPRKSRVRIGA